MKDKKEIGKLIQEARKKKGYTQTQLAEKLNVSNKAISHWETGRYYPDYEYFNDIAKVLEINLNAYLKKETPLSKKIIKILLNIVFVFITIVLILYFINNYNKFAVYKIILDNEKLTLNNSYITKANDKLIINLGEIENKEYLYQPSYNLTLYYKKNKLININDYSHLTYQTNNREIINDLKNLNIEIEYNYFNIKIEKININLKINEIINSNKIINKKIDQNEETNKNQENLLLNNGYNKFNSNSFIKYKEEKKYTYDINKKTLYYQDKNITALYDGRKIKYIIIKDNEIIEEYKGISDKYPNSHDQIFKTIAEEYIKLTLEKE